MREKLSGITTALQGGPEFPDGKGGSCIQEKHRRERSLSMFLHAYQDSREIVAGLMFGTTTRRAGSPETQRNSFL
jgi:hypothetical protein